MALVDWNAMDRVNVAENIVWSYGCPQPTFDSVLQEIDLLRCLSPIHLFPPKTHPLQSGHPLVRVV
jgi:hypothetical protein